MIRKSCLDDASRLAEILIFAKRSAYRHIFQNDKVSFGEMQVLPLALQFIDTPNLLDNIIVFEDEFVKGMANTKQISVNGTVMTQIVELFVDPFFQHYGIGGKLLSEIESCNKSIGVNGIFLWVLEKNTDAIRFYKKHGFVPTGERILEEGTSEYITKYTKEIVL